uniref:Uncharacterized protein n=1 Tax=Rousettus aegyptiacus TaxID=9407 RepID=A0A7J8JGW8_ROUAE|nr:hypothetical protein HJG63_010328 [Rousettus aegyptiacus]
MTGWPFHYLWNSPSLERFEPLIYSPNVLFLLGGGHSTKSWECSHELDAPGWKGRRKLQHKESGGCHSRVYLANSSTSSAREREGRAAFKQGRQLCSQLQPLLLTTARSCLPAARLWLLSLVSKSRLSRR